MSKRVFGSWNPARVVWAENLVDPCSTGWQYQRLDLFEVKGGSRRPLTFHDLSRQPGSCLQSSIITPAANSIRSCTRTCSFSNWRRAKMAPGARSSAASCTRLRNWRVPSTGRCWPPSWSARAMISCDRRIVFALLQYRAISNALSPKRRLAIEAAAEAHGYRSPKGMELAVLRTRQAKHDVCRDALFESWRTEARSWVLSSSQG